MNKMYLSGYSNINHYINNKKVLHNEKAFEYDGSHLQMFENKNGKISYERLSNSDLKSLLRVNYSVHKKDLLQRLKDELLHKKYRRRNTRKHKKRKSKRNTRSKK